MSEITPLRPGKAFLPIGFQTMTGGVLRGRYYFFQATGVLTFPMN